MSTHRMTYEQFVKWAAPKVGTAAGRDEVRRALVERVGYANRTPDEKTAQAAIKELSASNFGEANLVALQAISAEVSEAINGENEMAENTTNTTAEHPDVARVREMIRIEASDPELRRALQRNSAEGLTPRQAAQFDEYKALETANNEQAYKERAVKSASKGPRPYIPSDAMVWLTNPHKEQRRQLAAEWKARNLRNPDSDYWHPERGALSKSARLAMKAAYEAAETGEVNSVRINPDDGTIEEE
jgi:hypothetical protein